MIDLESQYIKDYLAQVSFRASQVATAFAWLEGVQSIHWPDILPNVDLSNTKTYNDLRRYERQIQSIGPRILRTKKTGSIGYINWANDSERFDEELSELNLKWLASKILKEFVVTGIAALHVYNDEETNDPKMQVLSGYIDPFYPEDDLGGEIVGLYHTTGTFSQYSTGQVKYTVNIWDFEEETRTVWENLDEPFEIGKMPTQVYENSPMPIFQVLDTDQDGYTCGEFQNALPIIVGELSQQLRIIRQSESHAFQPVYTKGHWKGDDKIGPNRIYRADGADWKDAEIGRLEAGSMLEQFQLADRILERIRADLALPVHFTGTQPPSGVALTELNLSYLSSIQDYANEIGDLLTRGTQAYAELIGVSGDIQVSVSPNREQFRQQRIESITSLYEKGLLPKEVAAREVQPYFATYTDEELEEFVSEVSLDVSQP